MKYGAAVQGELDSTAKPVLSSHSKIGKTNSQRHHCGVSLSKTHLSLLSTGSTQEDPSQHN